jgi:hypothetical protein
MNGKLAKAIAHTAFTLFNEDGIAVVPLNPKVHPNTSLKPEGEPFVVDKRGVEKCVKHFLWDRRNLPLVQSGKGAIVVGRRDDDDTLVICLCSQEAPHG